jgi:molecular chaperone Hsp33
MGSLWVQESTGHIEGVSTMATRAKNQRIESRGQPPSTGDRLALGVAAMGQLRWVATDLAIVAEEARQRLDLSPIAAVALGQGLAASAMLLRFATKVPARLTLELVGDGPLGRVVAEAKSDGSLRGLVQDPRVAGRGADDLSLDWALGSGLVRVTREQGEHRHTSQVTMGEGEMAFNIAHYLEQSEQIHSAVLLGVQPRPTGVVVAGGMIIEALPGTDESVLSHLEENLRQLSVGVSSHLEAGGLEALLQVVLAGLDREELETYPLAYRCSCDSKSLAQQLAGLAAKDLDSVVGDDGQCAAVCVFCGERYLFSRQELAALAEQTEEEEQAAN